MIPEREREALMRLTMCAREECVMCKYHKECDFDFQYKLATESMNILADALRKTEPTISKMEQVETMSCQECKHWNVYKGCRERVCKYEPKDEPQKDCKKCKNYDRCKNNRWKCCVYEPKDEPQTERSEP